MTRHRFRRRAAPALLITIFLPSCAIFRKELPLTPEMAYVRGMQAYQGKHYARAAELLKRWVDANAAGDPRMPQALVALGTSHLHTGEYLTAASEFLRVITDYQEADPQQASRYGLCEAYHSLSPRAQLDQQYTETAITYCASFAEYYGTTPDGQQAQRWVTEMREKLAYKAYLNGMFYARRQAFDAAIIYFNDAANGYPDTKWAPAALAEIVSTYRRIGYAEEAEEARQRLLRDFPQSAEAHALATAPPTGPPSSGSAATPPPAPAPAPAPPTP
jgi:outer membrane protein assembly factor BamD